MAYIEITTTEITSGKPVAATTQTKIRENFIDHENRLVAAEASSSSFPPIILRVNGRYDQYGPYVGAIRTTVNFALSIQGVRILVDKAGSSGSLEVDIKRKRGVGSWESIFTTLPIIAASAGDDALSAAGILDPTKVDLIAGDILRLDITSVQTGGRKFLVRVDYNRGS